MSGMIPADAIISLLAPIVRESEGFSHVRIEDNGQFVIGHGRKATASDPEEVTMEWAWTTLLKDLAVANVEAKEILGDVSHGLIRDCVPVEMCFALGQKRFSEFIKFIYAWRNGEINKAAYEMLDSKAAWGDNAKKGWGRRRSMRMQYMMLFNSIVL